MNKKILFVSVLSWMLVGCAMQDPSSCPPQRSKACTGNPQTPTINLNTQQRKLKATPYCVRAEPGTVVIFRLTPKGNKAKGIVEIKPKNPDHDWLAGKNDTYQDLIVIPVPDDLPSGNYDYRIETDTDCVDPRVNVN